MVQHRRHVTTVSPLVSHDEDLLHFPLPGLLQEHSVLVVDRHLYTASLLHSEAESPHMDVQVQLTTNGIRVLVPLLQTYPNYAPYASLLSHFWRIPLEQCSQMLHDAHARGEYELIIRPLRSTVSRLSDGVRYLGLEVLAIRSTGYLLKRASQAHLLH